jgi:hypothetical protein
MQCKQRRFLPQQLASVMQSKNQPVIAEQNA